MTLRDASGRFRRATIQDHIDLINRLAGTAVPDPRAMTAATLMTLGFEPQHVMLTEEKYAQRLRDLERGAVGRFFDRTGLTYLFEDRLFLIGLAIFAAGLMLLA